MLHNVKRNLNILVAENDTDTRLLYKSVLAERNHQIRITNNGKECLEVYNEELQNKRLQTSATEHIQPFDAVIVDYKMPQINGLEVVEEILTVNPHQRLIFTSAYIKENLIDSNIELKQQVELLQKPFEKDVLVDTIEDKGIYSELQKKLFLNNIDVMKAANFRHEQLRDLINILRKYTE
jgi:CheY-like chemotaxis protein